VHLVIVGGIRGTRGTQKVILWALVNEISLNMPSDWLIPILRINMHLATISDFVGTFQLEQLRQANKQTPKFTLKVN